MHVSKVKNVCQALPATIDILLKYGVQEESRAGPVLVAPWPITTVTENPTERVLFSTIRDANPFLMLYEAIWMLAGRDDAASLDRYVRDFGARFAEPDGRIHDAYGRRWRSAFGFDQLDHVVRTLRRDPTSRQCVVQMWNGMPEMEIPSTAEVQEWPNERSVGNDLRGKWRGRPCNTHIYLRVRNSALDLTVCCRSNDMLWGAHNTNQASFSVLQEYLAAWIGVDVGIMYQISNNAHVYLDELTRLERRAARQYDGVHLKVLPRYLEDDRYYGQGLLTTSMFSAPDAIDEDLRRFTSWHDELPLGPDPEYANPWLATTLARACRAHAEWRIGCWPAAMRLAREIEAADWRLACREWLERRRK